MIILRKEGIQAVTNLDGFLQVDRNSFVMTINPGAPICGTVADLTLNDGGPAALFCNKIDQDFMKPETTEDKWKDNESTKNLVDWTKKCNVEYFGDAEDLMGMSVEEFKKTYPLAPAQMPNITQEEKELKNRAVECATGGTSASSRMRTCTFRNETPRV